MEVKAGGERGECNERHSICCGENGKKNLRLRMFPDNPFVLLATGEVNVNLSLHTQ